jgi:hypothetical protein
VPSRRFFVLKSLLAAYPKYSNIAVGSSLGATAASTRISEDASPDQASVRTRKAKAWVSAFRSFATSAASRNRREMAVSARPFHWILMPKVSTVGR